METDVSMTSIWSLWATLRFLQSYMDSVSQQATKVLISPHFFKGRRVRRFSSLHGRQVLLCKVRNHTSMVTPKFYRPLQRATGRKRTTIWTPNIRGWVSMFRLLPITYNRVHGGCVMVVLYV